MGVLKNAEDQRNPKGDDLFVLQIYAVLLAASDPDTIFEALKATYTKSYAECVEYMLDFNVVDSEIPNKEIMDEKHVIQKVRANVKALNKEKYFKKKGQDARRYPPATWFFEQADYWRGAPPPPHAHAQCPRPAICISCPAQARRASSRRCSSAAHSACVCQAGQRYLWRPSEAGPLVASEQTR